MSSVEDLLEARKVKVADQLVKEILDGWLKYVATLEGTEKERVQGLQDVELNKALLMAYLLAEARKENKGGKALPAWKLTKPSQDAETEVRGARADKLKADNRAAFILGLNPFLAPATVAQGGGTFLYRNVGNPVTPALVIGQRVYRGRYAMEPEHVGVLRRIYQNSPSAVIIGYVGTNEMFAPTGEQIQCMSMCTNPDDTLGNSPVWKFACPTPPLQVVPPATIVTDLGVTLAQASGLQDTAWSLRTNSGAIAGATVVAFVCNGRADEHIFLTELPLGPGFAFRKYQGEAYQCQWKVLSDTTVTAYRDHCAAYQMDI
jgi:hypothetical protein